jgi:predicted 3-demethylubiquinone-9 3-methyltransferase (glyoxalase superfamily)
MANIETGRKTGSKIVPSLWYTKDAEAAARFYAQIFPDSRVDRVTSLAADSPSGPAGSVSVVELTLCGQAFMAMSAGPHDPFNHAISFTVMCDDQAEVDRFWDALLAGGGAPQQCGWLRDRFGLYWQVVPRALGDMMADRDRAKAARAAHAMLKMVKLDLPALRRAYEGA